MLGVWTEANLNCKLNDVINEGILDSILPYLVGYKKPSKTTSVYAPIIKSTPPNSSTDVKKPASFGDSLIERNPRLGGQDASRFKVRVLHRAVVNVRKAAGVGRLAITVLTLCKKPRESVAAWRRTSNTRTRVRDINERGSGACSGDVEIHVCDEVKGLKKDFRCAQKLLVAKMGYFADVTAGQRLEDMDISVHCDIQVRYLHAVSAGGGLSRRVCRQIFEWLMRWVKRDSILVADWPLLDAHNVVPILVSASFLQMEPLLHDCLIYCHAHMSDIVNTSTNLACLSDALLTRYGMAVHFDARAERIDDSGPPWPVRRLAAMYTNAELEAVRDRKDKIQSRLYCKLILALAEPVPETLRGHHASLAALFKCSR
ncbi:jg6176, partial [Pararge aegeria aegeria]